MKLTTYVDLMRKCGDFGLWGSDCPMLDEIQIYYCEQLIVEAPSHQDKTVVLRAILIERDYSSAEALQDKRRPGEFIYGKDGDYSLWSFEAEQF